MKDYFRVKEPEVNINNSLPVARPGLVFIIISVFVFVVSLPVGCPYFSFILLVIAAFVIWFFRDPDRPVVDHSGFALSPADGRVIKVENVADNPFTKGPAKKISIFMNVLNVHVNRIPLDGVLLEQIYFPGKFFNANFDKASEDNERNALILQTRFGRVAMVQIAGLIARRIVTWVKEGEELQGGQRCGMIRFGSRVDLYLPADSEVVVQVGQDVSAGLSPIWRLPQTSEDKGKGQSR